MKNLSYIVIGLALFACACNKGIAYTPADNAPQSNYGEGLTYDQINGNYLLYDSTYYIGNQAVQYIYDKYKHPIARPINIAIDKSTANFYYNSQKYYETHTVSNEYQTADSFFDIQKIRFRKDTIYINYFKR